VEGQNGEKERDMKGKRKGGKKIMQWELKQGIVLQRGTEHGARRTKKKRRGLKQIADRDGECHLLFDHSSCVNR